ncbi:MAG: hypothetical protein HY924_06845 [Elusimicrobia bacterium]|nr:hypothetical protein [Elusimicrobiota bacterium]
MIPPSLRWRRLGLVVGAAVAAGFLLTRGPVMDILAAVAGGFMERRSQKVSLSALIEEANGLGLDYAAIRREPARCIGKPVVWCVDHPSWGTAYLAGKPSEPLILENESAFPLNSAVAGGRCRTVVATVAEVRPEAVVLRFVGLP